MKKRIILVIIIFLLIMLVAFAGVYAYITLDLFRTPKQLFGKYLDNQIEQINNMNTGALKTVTENLKAAPSQTEYSMDLKSNDDDISLSYNQTVILDPENFTGMIKLNTTLESMDMEEYITEEDLEEVPELPLEIMDYTLYGNKDKVVLKIPELNEKYFSIKTDTILEKAQETLESKNISNVELSKENIERYKNEFKNLYNKYLEEIKTQFTDDKFSADKNVEVDVNGTKLTANRYTFSIPTTELKTIIIDLLTKISDEPILAEFIPEEQISSFKDNISTLTDDVDVLQEDATLKLCVYENSGNTVKIELKVNDDVLAEMMTTRVSDSEVNLIINVIKRKTEEGEVGTTQTIMYSVNSENENTTTATTTTSIIYEKEDIEELKKYYEEEGYYYYTSESIDETYKDQTTSQTVKTTVNGNTATSQISINNPDQDEDSMQISNIKIKYQFNITPKFDKFEDVIELDEYLDDETKLMELVTECMQNLQNNQNTFLGNIYTNYMSFSNSFTNMNTNISNELSVEDNQDKEKVEELVSDALNACLDSYKRDLEEDENTNIADYLTVNKISEMILSSRISNLELIDGSTLKCTYDDEVYYVSLIFNSETLKVDTATAYTESEYQDL